MELTTTSMPDTSIAAFAAAVRERLDDLPADEVDELVDGLEADLADQAIDRGGEFVLGDPGEYAAELRSAAGIAPRTESSASKAQWVARLGGRMSSTWRSWSDGIRRNKAAAWVLDLLIALRPVWWLARGWAAYAMVAPWFGIYFLTPHSDMFSQAPIGTVMLALAVLISIQWGRGRWAPRTWVRVIRTVVSIITAVALPFLIGATINSVRSWQDYAVYPEYSSPTPGLAVDGERVRNVFAYDAEGNPIENVQLFDQNGRPLTTVGTQYVDSSMQWDDYFGGGGGPIPVPVTAPGRQPVWNIFPLREMAYPLWDDNGRPDTDTAVMPVFPFAQVPAIQGTAPTPEPTETPATEGVETGAIETTGP